MKKCIGNRGKGMRIGILTYDVKHRKTYDTLCLLKAKGYDNVNVVCAAAAV